MTTPRLDRLRRLSGSSTARRRSREPGLAIGQIFTCCLFRLRNPLHLEIENCGYIHAGAALDFLITVGKLNLVEAT